ncbi:ATP-binding protein [Devosia sp. Leaf64]|uniref:ATP-binding protein n=1 Tax=Devosia sp. Leaf64 TaxID=1736229 RepID=UPI000712758F|nr:ATP-binding protein [Devosia sp. Leaf64]KQN78393.1 hypothetical protein ASE94_15575 [Devosia sp. Leaf64]
MISTKSASELIQELNITDETEHLEAKTISEDSVGKSVFETICAFANEPDLGGGTLLLGVEKEESLFPLYKATGIADPDKITSDIVSGCSSVFNNAIRPSISTEVVDGAPIIRVDVAELAAPLKPLYVMNQGLPRGAYRRVGSSDVRCTEEDLLTLYRGKQAGTFDSHVVDDATLDDIDPLAITAYRKARSELNPEAIELQWTDQELLHAVGAIRRVDGKIRVTSTGILVFGSAAANRRAFPTHRVDYIRVQGREWVKDPENRFDAIDMRGPIVTLISRVLAAISDDLPKAFKLDEQKAGQRTDIPIIPLTVLREAVVNALMHRSFQVHQPIQIVRYSNRLVIKNPGYSLKSEERFDDPGSYNRNPYIAEILHDTRFAENKGSGIRVMRQMLRSKGLSLPTFDSDRENDSFTAIFLFHHFLNEDDWEWLKHFRSLDLSEDQMRALVFVREVGAIDNSTYRSLTQTDTLAASHSLRRLKSLDLLAARGSSSKTYYVAGPRLEIAVSAQASNLEGKTSDLEGNEANLEGKITRLNIQDIPSSLRKEVRTISLSSRLKPEQAKKIIVELCKWKPLSAAELAALLQKSPKHLTDAYLYGMIRDGELRYLYPEMVNHPHQKYVAAV